MSEIFPFSRAGGPWDPRGYRRRFDPESQADERQLQRAFREIGGNPQQLAAMLDRIKTQQPTPRTVVTAWLTNIGTAANVPVQLLPRNPKRVSYILNGFAPQGILFWSFGYPFFQSYVVGIPPPALLPVGFRLPVIQHTGGRGTLLFPGVTNGTVPIDDIWGWGNGGQTLGAVALAFEAIIAESANAA